MTNKPASLSSALLGVPKGEATPHVPDEQVPVRASEKATRIPTFQRPPKPRLVPLLVRIEEGVHDRMKAYSFQTGAPIQHIANELFKRFLDEEGA
jgi:hypothetical protein